MYIKTTSTHIIDMLPTAELIQFLAGHFLIAPPPGVYAAHRRDPVLIGGNHYHRYEIKDGVRVQIAIESFADVEKQMRDGRGKVVKVIEDVYDNEGSKINLHHLGALSDKPTFPIIPIQLIEEMATATLIHLSEFHHGRPSYEEIIGKYLQPAYSHDDRIIDIINNALVGVRDEIVRFVGGDSWIMHFTKTHNGSELIVQKTIDYRIHQWEQEHGASFRRRR